MAYEMLVAVFDTSPPAEAAVDALKAGGFHEDDISIFDNYRLSTATSALAQSVQEAGLWHRLFGSKVFEHEAAVYGQTVARGGTVISLCVVGSEVAHATDILDLHRPIDVHDRAVTSGIALAAKVETAAAAVAAAAITVEQKVAVTPRIAQTHVEILCLAEEQLQVGKQMVETGKTRVRRFVTERDVSADVTLHEEHADVIRRAVSDPKYIGEIDWADSTIEVIESAEHALVNKTARVVEEVSLKKIGSEHVETVHEKLRRQQTEIGQIYASGRQIQPPTV